MIHDKNYFGRYLQRVWAPVSSQTWFHTFRTGHCPTWFIVNCISTAIYSTLGHLINRNNYLEAIYNTLEHLVHRTINFERYLRRIGAHGPAWELFRSLFTTCWSTWYIVQFISNANYSTLEHLINRKNYFGRYLQHVGAPDTSYDSFRTLFTTHWSTWSIVKTISSANYNTLEHLIHRTIHFERYLQHSWAHDSSQTPISFRFTTHLNTWSIVQTISTAIYNLFEHLIHRKLDFIHVLQRTGAYYSS